MGAKRRSKNRPPKKNKRASRRRVRKPRSTLRPSAGTLIARGVKSLVSSVPGVGGILGDVADIVFKSLGIVTSAEADSVGNYKFKGAAARMYQLVTRFQFPLTTIVSGSRETVQLDMGRSFLCNYCDFRCISVTINAKPTGPISARQGQWTMAFQPFFTLNDAKRDGFKNNDWNPTKQSMFHMYRSVTGSASQPLTLTYRPQVTDGLAFQFQSPIDTAYGEVAILYEDPCRDDYSDFKPSEFSCDVIISGSVECRTSPAMPPSDRGGYEFTGKIVDVLKDVKVFLQSSKHVYKLRPPTTCVDAEGHCVVTGTTTEVMKIATGGLDREDQALGFSSLAV